MTTRHGLLGLLVLCVACASHPRAPSAPIPPAEAGQVRVAAVAGDAVRDVQPIAIAVTNGRDRPVYFYATQVYAHREDGDERTAPVVPAEAARLAGGKRAPGEAAKNAAVGAATGSVLGAAGGAISGAIQGGVGLATGAGAAVGAFFGILGGLWHGGQAQPDVEGFESRALHDQTMPPRFSATGYVYFPKGTYRTIEVLLVDDAEHVHTLTVPVETAQ